MIYKQCSQCGETKPATVQHFGYSKKYKGNLRGQCRVCRRENGKKRDPQKRHEEFRKIYYKDLSLSRNKGRASHFKKKYGLTVKAYENMFIEQQFKCAICGIHQSDTRKFHVDHNHETGKVRKLLCPSCNWMIGNCRENTEILSAGIKYLEEN